MCTGLLAMDSPMYVPDGQTPQWMMACRKWKPGVIMYNMSDWCLPKQNFFEALDYLSTYNSMLLCTTHTYTCCLCTSIYTCCTFFRSRPLAKTPVATMAEYLPSRNPVRIWLRLSCAISPWIPTHATCGHRCSVNLACNVILMVCFSSRLTRSHAHWREYHQIV